MDREMIKNHPISKAILVLRCWLVLVTAMMAWNAVVSVGFLLQGWLRPMPFVFLASLAAIWMIKTWDMRVVILASSAITVGTLLRAIEVVLYADQYDLRARLTGASIWTTIAGTTIAFGILNVLAVSRKTAEDWVWREQSLAD